jgi:dihydrofolate synthase / folylpolyglutamate synthase
MNYQEATSYLYGLGHEVLAAKFGLESITLLLERLGNPERRFKSVIVAGTNGKGSVSAMIESIARIAGHRTALYTSPHLVRLEERMRVGGAEISETELARLATAVRAAAEALVAEGKLESVPTFFEQVMAVAMLDFRDRGAALAILEVGLGGRLDATNAVDRILSIVTSIDFDHQNILGDTIEQIAGEKAAIIVPGTLAVIGRQNHEAATDVLMTRCLETGVLPVFANQPTDAMLNEFGCPTFDYESALSSYKRIGVALRGLHQSENAAAVIEAVELLSRLGFKIPRDAIIKGLREVQWPGRLELVEDSPRILLDGAHNAAGACVLRKFLDAYAPTPLTLIFGAMMDKDVDRMAAELFGAARTIVLTRIRDGRAATSAQLGKWALGSPGNVIFTESVRQALSWARSVTPKEGMICVAGSLHLVGEVKRLIAEEDTEGQRYLAI